MTMKHYDKLTVLRNRHRARDLRMFRKVVEEYFERSEYDSDGLPVDWEGAQTARSQIHRMLPRILQVVKAAGIGSPETATDPGVGVGDPDALQHIFTSRYVDTGGQEILDVIDMAMGVYEANRFNALGRTVNPLYYTATLLAFVVSLPRRFFRALGFRPPRSRVPSIRAEDVARLEAVAARLANAEELIETRFSEMRDRQAQLLAENARQISELAERLDFTERVLAQQRPLNGLKAPDDSDVITPV
jgi:hypothetical protein